MGLFLDPLASVNEARGLHGTATTPSYGIQGSFNCKDYHLVNKGFWFIGGHNPSRTQPKWIRTHWFEHSVDLSERVPSEYEVRRNEKLPSEASDYCNVCLFNCLLMHVVMYLCSYFYYKYIWPLIVNSIVCFLHLNISSVLDANSDREIATTASPHNRG